MMRQKGSFSQRFKNTALLVLILPFILPLALIGLILHLLFRAVLYLLVWSLWLPKGKDILLVFSQSPVWHEYMVTHVLPLIEQRAIVLNWSERSNWKRWSLAVAVFRNFGGSREYNPMILLFRPLHAVRTFRFWYAFKDWKHGDSESVSRVRDDLLSAL